MVYQAPIRRGDDVTAATPGLSGQRVSFTVLLQAAADQIIATPGPARSSTASLIGAVDRPLPLYLLPDQHRQLLKASYRRTSGKYQFQRDRHPRTGQTCTPDFKMGKDGDIDAGPDGSRDGVALGGTPPALPRSAGAPVSWSWPPECPDWVGRSAICPEDTVLDVGIHRPPERPVRRRHVRVARGRPVGAGPGGGSMTIAMLLSNTRDADLNQV